MPPSGPLTRTSSLGTISSRSESRGYVRATGGTSMRVEQDPDVAAMESGRWSFVDHHRQRSVEFPSERRGSLGRLGSRRSQLSHSRALSALDMLAAGLDIDCLPFYDITVRNLFYKVNIQSKKDGPQQKILINNVNAEAYHGEILAVVGPSGSGKTTFLDALAGRIVSNSLQGEILVNGDPKDDWFNRISGYVMQDDALFPMLTVRETMMYSALLRLPDSMPYIEKENRVTNMINTLGLKQCADTRVGNDKIRGVSGGERRRVSIGNDLIHDPAVFFLDEPTSGLDSTSALNVMQNLSKMAKSGKRTVVLTIHQPSYRILETIDRVLVLGQGNVIFHGRHAGIKDHFNSLGRTMPGYVNCIEYVLDTIEDYQKSPEGLQPLVNLELAHKISEKDNELESQIEMDEQPESGDAPPAYATSLWSETLVLADRNFKNTCRTPELFLSRMGMMIVVGLTLGTLFLQAKVDMKGIQQRTSFISFSLALLMFTSTDSMGPFLEERQIYIRETSRGAYRAGTYVLSGAIVVVPFLFFLSMLYSGLAYWLVGLVANVHAFFFFCLMVFLSLCAANSFVIFFSSLVPSFTIGLSLVSAAMAYFFLFSGFFISRDSIPPYWIWLHYISLFKYPYEALLANELHHLKGVVWYADVTSEEILAAVVSGKVYQWVNIFAMIMLFIGYRVIFWFILKYFTKCVRK